MTIKCLKGSLTLGLEKGITYQVLDLYQFGEKFGHQTRMVIKKYNRRQTLYVPIFFKNRLGSPRGFNVNQGDVTVMARMAFVGEFTARKGGYKR